MDDLTCEHAIEYDFANKWAEAVGQSMYYAAVTGKKAGIVLILKKEGDFKQVRKIQALGLPVDLWVVRNLKEPPKRIRY